MKLDERMRAIILEQAADEGLWFVIATAPEAYLQEALRKLHSLIEDEWADEVAFLASSLAEARREIERIKEIHRQENLATDKHIQRIQIENERLREKVGIAYWHGHTNGRIYGRESISKEEIECGSRWIESAIQATEEHQTSQYSPVIGLCRKMRDNKDYQEE